MKQCRYLFTISFLVLASISAFCQKSNTVIKGKILHNKYKVAELRLAYGNNPAPYGTASIKEDGTFVLNADILNPDIFHLYFAEKEVFLFPLYPNQTVNITIDADNLQSIVAVDGSPSLSFVKQASDILNNNKSLLDSINGALQQDPDQVFFNSFYQQFSLYNKTHHDVDEHITDIFQNNDSLVALAQRCSDNKKITAKELDIFVIKAVPLLKNITNSYTAYANYIKNDNNSLFEADKLYGYTDFYSSLLQYDKIVTEKKSIVNRDLSDYVKTVESLLKRRDDKIADASFDKKKEKTIWANEVLDIIFPVADLLSGSEKQYLEKMNLSESRSADILAFSQKTVSGIVQKYQTMYNTENEKRTNQLKNLLLANKEDIAVIMLLDIFPREKNVALHQEVINALYKVLPNNMLVQERYKVETSPATATSVGAIAPELAFLNPDGQVLKLSNLRGNIVLVDFWASWCRPCRMENPHVVEVYKKYHEKGFEVFSVSLDRDKSSWVKAIADDHLTWANHVSDLKYWSSEGAKLYGVSSIPCIFLLDRDGRIIAKNLRGEALSQALKQIFGE